MVVGEGDCREMSSQRCSMSVSFEIEVILQIYDVEIVNTVRKGLLG